MNSQQHGQQDRQSIGLSLYFGGPEPDLTACVWFGETYPLKKWLVLRWKIWVSTFDQFEKTSFRFSSHVSSILLVEVTKGCLVPIAPGELQGDWLTNGEMPEAVVLILPGWGLLHLTKVVTGFLELVHNDLTCNLVVLCDWLIIHIPRLGKTQCWFFFSAESVCCCHSSRVWRQDSGHTRLSQLVWVRERKPITLKIWPQVWKYQDSRARTNLKFTWNNKSSIPFGWLEQVKYVI